MKGRQRDTAEPRDRVGFRLGEGPRDRQLADYIDRARRDGVNISDLIRSLLWAHFTGEVALPEPDSEQEGQAVDDALAAKLASIRFTGLG